LIETNRNVDLALKILSMENLDDHLIFECTKTLISVKFAEINEQLIFLDNWVQLEEALIKVLNYLLDHDLSQLLSILYRIDVSEEMVKSILSSAQPDKVASELAKCIVLRLKQKSISRIGHN
jgi:hypothetical protein